MNNLAQAGAVRSWLISITHHRTIDYLRGVRRRASLKEEAKWEEVELDERAAVPDVWEEGWRSVQRRPGASSIDAYPYLTAYGNRAGLFSGLDTHGNRWRLPDTSWHS